MHIDVIKFGGTSLADNEKLKLTAQKTISFLEKTEDNKVVVIVSAQGKKTNQLIEEAKEMYQRRDTLSATALQAIGYN